MSSNPSSVPWDPPTPSILDHLLAHHPPDGRDCFDAMRARHALYRRLVALHANLRDFSAAHSGGDHDRARELIRDHLVDHPQYPIVPGSLRTTASGHTASRTHPA